MTSGSLRGDGPYQIQAAINAVHGDARTATAAGWGQTLRLYDQLMTIALSKVAAQHRAVAVGEVRGPQAARTLVNGLDLDAYHLSHAVRARDDEAALPYDEAIARPHNAAERAFLQRRRNALGQRR